MGCNCGKRFSSGSKPYYSPIDEEAFKIKLLGGKPFPSKEEIVQTTYNQNNKNRLKIKKY